MAQEEVGFVAMTQDSFLEATLDETLNSWKVTQIITQRRKVDAESEWEERDITMTAISKDVDIAMAQVFLSMEGYLITRNHDLFTEPEAQSVEVTDGTVVH
ncbi:unnamed protein product [marine sediment metagenome]|uniref:Uncharacterized protein n=1 Tax=marine sediment metagenome TaxID=412755 RepID=X0RGM4_9ZZZZ